jgi:DNA-binding MarR family transcriptional regulator
LLAQKKLITQRASKQDTRVRHITITAAGISLLAKATPAIGALQKKLFPPGADTDKLLAMVKAVAHRLETRDPDLADITVKL